VPHPDLANSPIRGEALEWVFERQRKKRMTRRKKLMREWAREQKEFLKQKECSKKKRMIRMKMMKNAIIGMKKEWRRR
jgi:hypothetical protein